MYGGRQYATYDQGWIGWFCKKALDIKNGTSAGPFSISGDGKQVRDILNVDDVVDLYFAIIQNIRSLRGHVFNVGGGMANSLSLLELFSFLERELDVCLIYMRLPPRQSDQKIFVADMGKLKHSLGWEPQIGFPEGIRTMVQWTEGL
jgi:CDP-paratose 2-epimerase